ncbi:triose-phosphate transporter family-domain-containing protein [Chytridium lagenaria]|nr:triose-phosphate transporter family-domain-containing protein [Chytridium lagenaria]
MRHSDQETSPSAFDSYAGGNSNGLPRSRGSTSNGYAPHLPSLKPHRRDSDGHGLSGNTYQSWIRFIVLCFLWYLSSAITNNVGKQLMGIFNYPVTLTYFQFGIVAVLSFLSSKSSSGLGRIRGPTYEILMTTAPLSIFQILGHIFSSMAISRVSVSFAHTIKALSPLFTVFVYRFFFSISYSRKVYFSLLPLTIGVMLVCSNKVSFQVLGFIFALMSTVVFVLQNIFSKKLFIQSTRSSVTLPHKKKLDKLNLLFYSSLIAFVLMTPLWLYSDGFLLLRTRSLRNKKKQDLNLPSYSPVNGLTHFSQAVFAFWILSLVSPVTYSIASLFKRIFVIIASILYFGESISLTQAFGICLTFAGLYMYDNAKADIAHGEAQLV